MNKKNKVYFHLGYPKVASTFLQKEIFPHLSNVKFHKKHRFSRYKELDPGHLRENHLFSSEKDYNLEEAADDIIEHITQAKFILFLRRHDKWILSRYKYYIRKHGSKEFHEFFDLKDNKGIWKHEDLFYRNKIAHLEKISQHPPLILTLDALKNKPEQVFTKIEEYTGSKISEKANKDNVINRAFSLKQLLILRKFNRLYPYKKLNTPVRILDKIHYRYRQYILHIVAFFSHLVPWTLIKKRELVDPSFLEEVRKYYEQDWKYCVEYVKKKNQFA